MREHFDTSLLDEAIAKKRRSNEALRQARVKQILSMLPQWSERYGFRRAIVFGSLARPGHYSEDSDVDLAVEGLSNKNYFSFLAEVTDVLEANTDVVQLEKSTLRERIIEEGLEWRKNG